jgi:hypothetical protein
LARARVAAREAAREADDGGCRGLARRLKKGGRPTVEERDARVEGPTAGTGPGRGGLGGSEPLGRRGERWPAGRGRRAVVGEGGRGRAFARQWGGGPRRRGVEEGGPRRREPHCVRAQGVAAQARMGILRRSGRSTDAERPASARSGGNGCVLGARAAIPLLLRLLDLWRRTELQSRERAVACLLTSLCWLGKKVSHSIEGG